jgi:CheY-like chemotaxis protein
MSRDHELVAFAEDAPMPVAVEREPWRVLVVDDDEEVHLVTRLTLRGLEVEGRPVCLHSAKSRAEAQEVFASGPPFAVALVDVVMESATAGLDLLRWVRQDLGERATRLLVRTGHPGLLEEGRIAEDYDIHDYLPKAETSGRSLSARTAGAIRAWRDLQVVHAEAAVLRSLLGAMVRPPGERVEADLYACAPLVLPSPRGRLTRGEVEAPAGRRAALGRGWELVVDDGPELTYVERLRLERWSVEAGRWVS